jgi:hypothetical protein
MHQRSRHSIVQPQSQIERKSLGCFEEPSPPANWYETSEYADRSSIAGTIGATFSVIGVVFTGAINEARSGALLAA